MELIAVIPISPWIKLNITVNKNHAPSDWAYTHMLGNVLQTTDTQQDQHQKSVSYDNKMVKMFIKTRAGRVKDSQQSLQA